AVRTAEDHRNVRGRLDSYVIEVALPRIRSGHDETEPMPGLDDLGCRRQRKVEARFFVRRERRMVGFEPGMPRQAERVVRRVARLSVRRAEAAERDHRS